MLVTVGASGLIPLPPLPVHTNFIPSNKLLLSTCIVTWVKPRIISGLSSVMVQVRVQICYQR